MAEILAGLFGESNFVFSHRPTAAAGFLSVICSEMKLEAAAAVLGVAVDADPETLKAAYRRLALRWHPDKCKDPDAKERFQEVFILLYFTVALGVLLWLNYIPVMFFIFRV